jgi:hypothetical protein
MTPDQFPHAGAVLPAKLGSERHYSSKASRPDEGVAMSNRIGVQKLVLGMHVKIVRILDGSSLLPLVLRRDQAPGFAGHTGQQNSGGMDRYQQGPWMCMMA